MAFEGTSFNSNFPLASVVVPLVVPEIAIFAKSSGSLFSSNTVPETVIVLVDEVLLWLSTAGAVSEDVDVAVVGAVPFEKICLHAWSTHCVFSSSVVLIISSILLLFFAAHAICPYALLNLSSSGLINKSMAHGAHEIG